MLNVRDNHTYCYDLLEQRALEVKQRWIRHLAMAYMLLRDLAQMGPQYSSLGINLIGIAQRIAQEEAALSALQDADFAVRRMNEEGSEHDGD
jgi:hypothetical protein